MRTWKSGARWEIRVGTRRLFFTQTMAWLTLLTPLWIQGDFNTLVGLFDRVGLQTNVGKTVVMVYHPCQAAGNLSEAAYRRRVMGEDPTYRERLKGQV